MHETMLDPMLPTDEPATQTRVAGVHHPLVVTPETLAAPARRADEPLRPSAFRAAIASAVVHVNAHLVTPRELVLDLAGLPYPDRRALDELTAATNIAGRHGIGLRVLHVAESAREVLRMVNLDRCFRFGEATP